jgi:hypothetical protein
MKTSKNITVTPNRMEQSINNAVNRVMGPQIVQQINDTVLGDRLRIGVITKYYHFLDKAEVEFSDSSTQICRILHRFGGELSDYYTPSGDEDYCDDLHEPCIIPRAELEVAVANIQDSDEPLILGFMESELIGVNPATPGNLKIVTRGGTNQFWIKFGYDGLDLRLPDTASTNVGDMDSDMTPVDYANTDSVYTKDEVYNKQEVYTKEEVDELIGNKIAEFLGEEEDDTTN